MILLAITAGASRVATGQLCMFAVAITPAGLMELVRSCCSISGGHPDYTAGWLLRYMFRGLLSVHCTLRPTCSPSHLSDLLHQRLRRLRFLHRRSDCFRVERTKFPGGTFTRSHPAPFHGARVMILLAQNHRTPRVFTDCPPEGRRISLTITGVRESNHAFASADSGKLKWPLLVTAWR